MLYSGGNYRRARRGTVQEGASMTIQSAKDEADINVLVRRFGVTGVISGVERPPPLTEFQDTFDFRSALDAINAARRSFMELSADTRARFLNDPARFVDFCSARDENGELVNGDEMRKMGLALPKVDPVVPPPMRVEVVNPTPPA